MASSSRLVTWLNRLQPSAETAQLILAALVGLSTGGLIVLLRWSIGFFEFLFRDEWRDVLLPLGSWTVALIPALGGLLIGLLIWLDSILPQQLPQALAGLVRLLSKILGAALSLGAGASLGPEGPSVDAGSSIGSWLGYNLKASTERIGLLISAGAAAGLAAGFNAPIAGVFLAVELVLPRALDTATVSVVVLSAVLSALVATLGLGSQPAFMLPAYEVRSLLELPCYVGLGLLASLVSLAHAYAVDWSKAFFQGRIPGLRFLGKCPPLLKPVLGGLALGLLGLWIPLGLGVGYVTIESVLQDVPFSLKMLLTLLAGKLVMTAISRGSGFMGGIFAPSLFLGAVLGASYGKVLELTVSSWIPVADPPAYAMVGMGAVLATSIRAPLTVILLLFEMTRDYRIVLPLMASVGLSVWLLERLGIPSMYTPPALPLGIQPDPLALPEDGRLKVAEAMGQPLLMAAHTPFIQAVRFLLEQQRHCLLVVDDAQHLVGILTLQDIESWAESAALSGKGLPSVLQEACSTDVLTVFEDESLPAAQRRMATRDLHQLPVVSRQDPLRVVGLLERDDIALAQRIGVTRTLLGTAFASL